MISIRAQFTPRDRGQFVAAYISPAVEASVEASCKLVADKAKQYCPVDTGALRASIGTTVAPADKTVVGAVFATAPYAGYVEYGTGRSGASSPGAGAGPYSPNWAGMVAQPYMRPALNDSRPTVNDLFRSQISLALK